MNRTPLALAVLLAACTGEARDPTEAGAPIDAGRPCGLPAQLELRAAMSDSCAAPPIVVLTIAADGTVSSAAAHVPVGVSVRQVPCTSHAPDPSCAWMLDVACDGPNAERLTMTGTITGSGSAWHGDAVTIDLTGSPPGRLMCTASGAVATP